MGRKQKLKQERHAQKAGRVKPQGEVNPGARVRRLWLFGVLGALLILTVTGIVLFVQNQSKLFQMALLAQSYQIDGQLGARLGRFSTEDGRRLETILHQAQTMISLPGVDARGAGQLKFVLGVVDEIVRAGNVEPGELGKLEDQLQAARSYLDHQAHSRRP